MTDLAATEWLSGFDCPGEDWLPLQVNDLDGAELAARQIASREGERKQGYAEAVYPELKVIWDGMRARQASPVAVCVPRVPLVTRPLIPASISVVLQENPPQRRTTAAIAEIFRRPRPDRPAEPGITEIQLPLGPTCRVHEVLLNDAGDDGRQFVIEHVDYYVLPSAAPGLLCQLAVTWASPAIGPEMAKTADQVAASLTMQSAAGTE